MSLIWAITIASLSCPALCAGPFWQRSWEELRWADVSRQTTQANCGPAALATALHLAFSENTKPEELYPEDLPSSMAVLRDITVSRGYTAVGLHITLANLKRFLHEQQMPAIVRILIPTPHFTTVTGAVADRLLTRDPALGRVSWEEDDWLRIWPGQALLLSGEDPNSDTTDETALLDIMTLLMRRKDWKE